MNMGDVLGHNRCSVNMNGFNELDEFGMYFHATSPPPSQFSTLLLRSSHRLVVPR